MASRKSHSELGGWDQSPGSSGSHQNTPSPDAPSSTFSPTPGTTSHAQGANFPPSAQFRVILPSRFFLPSLVDPHPCPIVSPIPIPPPGIYCICAILSPETPLTPLPFPQEGEGTPSWDFCTETLLYATNFLYIFNFAAT